jgi:chemotaxis protein CheD
MAANEVRLGMGEGVVASDPQVVLSAGIGSCVVVILYDGGRRTGGVAHVMLPDSADVRGRSGPFQCADTAIATLLARLQSRGARPQDLVAKMVGGAQMFAGDNGAGIGKQNVTRLKDLLDRERIPLVGWDVAGRHGRSVEFHLASGKVVVRTLDKDDKQF